MSLFGKSELYAELKSPASKVYEIYRFNPYLVSNVSSNNEIQNCKLKKGEWGEIRSEVEWNYVHDGKACMAVDLVEVVDEKNNLIVIDTTEGDKLINYYKKFKSTMQCIAKENGCRVKWSAEYEKLHHEIPDSLGSTYLQFAIDFCKDIDAYLVAKETD